MHQVEPNEDLSSSDEDIPSLCYSIESASDTNSTTTFTNLPSLCTAPRRRLCISGDTITPLLYGFQDSPAETLLRQVIQLPGAQQYSDDLVISYYPTIGYLDVQHPNQQQERSRTNWIEELALLQLSDNSLLVESSLPQSFDYFDPFYRRCILPISNQQW